MAFRMPTSLVIKSEELDSSDGNERKVDMEVFAAENLIKSDLKEELVLKEQDIEDNYNHFNPIFFIDVNTLDPLKITESLQLQKDEKVKNPPSNRVTVKNLESEELSFIKLEEQVDVAFQHEVSKEAFDKHFDTRAEETKKKMKPAVSGKDPRAPYRKSKRGTMGVCYKFEMNEFEEIIESSNVVKSPIGNDQDSSSTDSEKANVENNNRRPKKKRFKHYKEFITTKRQFYDQSVLSRLLSIPPRKKSRRKKSFQTLIDGDSSEDIDSPPSDISVSDCDDLPTAVQDQDEISIQENAESPIVSDKFDDYSMPLIE